VTTNRTLARLSLALAGGALGVLTLAPSAAAPSEHQAHPAANAVVCPLERLGDQLVRCDNLTGNGGPAPWFIPAAR
jgi:hypothetical protein